MIEKVVFGATVLRGAAAGSSTADPSSAMAIPLVAPISGEAAKRSAGDV